MSYCSIIVAVIIVVAIMYIIYDLWFEILAPVCGYTHLSIRKDWVPTKIKFVLEFSVVSMQNKILNRIYKAIAYTMQRQIWSRFPITKNLHFVLLQFHIGVAHVGWQHSHIIKIICNSVTEWEHIHIDTDRDRTSIALIQKDLI